MDYQLGGFDSMANAREPEFAYADSAPFVDAVVYSAPSNGPASFSKTPSSNPTSYLPRPPHIAIPTSSSISGGASNRLDTGAIVGIVLGALASVIATGAIVFYLCTRRRSVGGTRKRGSRGSWIDLERKNTSERDSLPPYDEVKAPELGAFAMYTKYVPRTVGRLSPVSQTLPPTFDLIKEHHLSSDRASLLSTPPPRNPARKNTSPGYLDDVAITVTPFDTRFDS